MASLVPHVALLRGVNVGGRHRLPMADLAALATDAGAHAPKTFIQSGNLVCDLPADGAAAFADALAAGIAARFGFRSPVVVRSAAEWSAVVAAPPFDVAALHVAFLADVPPPARVAALDPARSPGDRFEVRGRDVFLHLPNGVAGTRITNDWLDRQLGTVSTARNWRTVLALAELLAAR